jgi:hypothetical protein
MCAEDFVCGYVHGAAMNAFAPVETSEMVRFSLRETDSAAHKNNLTIFTPANCRGESGIRRYVRGCIWKQCAHVCSHIGGGLVLPPTYVSVSDLIRMAAFERFGMVFLTQPPDTLCR